MPVKSNQHLISNRTVKRLRKAAVSEARLLSASAKLAAKVVEFPGLRWPFPLQMIKGQADCLAFFGVGRRPLWESNLASF
jgi:hypothetical protein